MKAKKDGYRGRGEGWCKDLLTVIPIWRYVILLILYNPVVRLSCIHSILLLHPTVLQLRVLVHSCLLSIHRDSIVLGRHSKRKGQEKIATLHCRVEFGELLLSTIMSLSRG